MHNIQQVINLMEHSDPSRLEETLFTTTIKIDGNR